MHVEYRMCFLVTDVMILNKYQMVYFSPINKLLDYITPTPLSYDTV